MLIFKILNFQNVIENFNPQLYNHGLLDDDIVCRQKSCQSSHDLLFSRIIHMYCKACTELYLKLFITL